MPIDQLFLHVTGRIVAATALALLLSQAHAGIEDPERIEEQLEELRSRIATIQERLDEDLRRRDSELEALARAERRVSAARRESRETARVLEVTRGEIESLEQQRGEMEEAVSRHARALARQLSVAYRHGAGSRLRMLLNQDDPRKVTRRLAYHGYLTRARLDAMEDLAGSIDQLERTRQQLDQELDSQRELLSRQREQLDALEQAYAQRSEAVATLDRRIEDDRERLSELEHNAAELTELLEELAGALADVPPELDVTAFRELRGQLPVPVEGDVLKRFGEHRGGEMEWNGWLIGADRGAEVRAIAHGRIAYADWLRGYGLLLIIDHGDGFMSLYAHNESLFRDVGDWVSPGEIVAEVGNTGGADEIGMYFELRREGRPINPAEWVSR